jgi:hypothetical protein
MSEHMAGGDPIHHMSPIEAVQEGMEVYDQAGNKVGKVEFVSMGDPEAVTTEGNELREPGLIGRVGMALFGDEREPDVPDPLRAELLRMGFIKVDGPGFIGDDRYVRSDQIQSVSGDKVTLAVDKEQVVKEDPY